MENFSKSGGKFFQIMHVLFLNIKLGNWSIKSHTAIIIIIQRQTSLVVPVLLSQFQDSRETSSWRDKEYV